MVVSFFVGSRHICFVRSDLKQAVDLGRLKAEVDQFRANLRLIRELKL